MQYTTNYNLITVEGTDVVNPLVQMNPNFTDIDSIMKDNADATVARATCTKTGTNHAVTTTNSDAAMQRFTATGNWETGDTMTIDGTSVSVYLPDGTAPQTGCFVINSEVIIAINGTRVTLYCAPALSQSASDISYDNTLSGLSASDVQDALDELALMPKGMNCLAVITTDAGCTVTLVKGGTTITATEVSSGVYEASFDEYGTWQVNNVTLGYSRNFTVDAVKVYNLSFIPDGRTITPVNDVQTLLHCAGIFDKGYTVLSQLIADTASLYSVITDNNAIDYLVRSTSFANGITGDSTAMTYIGSDNYAANTLLADNTWLNAICNSAYVEYVLNVKSPNMTSNTTPSGVCYSVLTTGSSLANPEYYGMDGNNSTYYNVKCATNDCAEGLAYDFGSDTNVKMVKFKRYYANASSYSCSKFKVLASDNNSVWTTAVDTTTCTSDDTIIVVPAGTAHRYWQHQITQFVGAPSSSGPTWIELQFFGRVDV